MQIKDNGHLASNPHKTENQNEANVQNRLVPWMQLALFMSNHCYAFREHNNHNM